MSMSSCPWKTFSARPNIHGYKSCSTVVGSVHTFKNFIRLEREKHTSLFQLFITDKEAKSDRVSVPDKALQHGLILASKKCGPLGSAPVILVNV
jgi:hypothetical protein